MLLWDQDKVVGTEARRPTYTEALHEASRCLVCYNAPCEGACPAGVPISTFIRRMRLGDFGGALRSIIEKNIFAGTCGLTCPRGMLCEEACILGRNSLPIRIRDLQLAAYLYGKDELLERRKVDSGKRVAILGGGVAGISCAYYLRGKGASPVIFEKHQKIGGMLTRIIPQYRLIKDVVDGEVAYATREIDVRTECDPAKLTLKLLRDQGFDAVFISTGLWHRPFESYRLVKDGLAIDAIDLLEEVRHKGSSVRRFGKKVAVIGGGNTACDTATLVKVISGSDVTVFYRRSRADMPAFKHEFGTAVLNGVIFQFNTAVVGAERSAGKILLHLARTQPGKIDSSGRASPMIVEGSYTSVEVDDLIIAVGAAPDIDWIRNSFGVDMDSKGIKVNQEMMTSVEGVFAGGDLIRGGGLVVEAVADAKKAADSIANFLGL